LSDVIIEVRNLWSQFGRQVVHRDLNFTVYRGEIISLVGGSGSGKTVLMRQILGLEKPARGEICVFGRELGVGNREEMRELRERWGVLFQEGALFSALSVYDNVALPLRELKMMDESMIRDLVLMKLAMVSIEARHADKMPSELSGGMVKRVALARALSLEPELLFLDEPTAGLDPDRSESFVQLLQALHRELKLTVVMITHDLETLVALSDRLAVLADQKLVAVGSVREVAAFDHPFVRNFFQGERGRRALELWKDRNESQAAVPAAPVLYENA
jgi:phospholipid/cholesterol/gamma-HCH transport system ATP-binding protein